MSSERRKTARLGLAIPIRVQGFRSDGSTWEEFSTTDDVSLGGICFPLTHEVELGHVLHLSLALPKRLRQYDLQDASYRVYTLVRSVRRRPDQPRVGVMFFGKFPPRDFHERPGARYLLPSDAPNHQVASELQEAGETSTGSPSRRPSRPEPPPPPPRPPASSSTGGGPGSASRPRGGMPPAPGVSTPVEFRPSRDVPNDRRGTPRVEIFVNFTIQQVDEWGAVLQEELTVADNVSPGGARVMTTLDLQEGDVILLQEAGGGFATRAEVRGITYVQPATGRLHLRFVDRQAPERILRQ
jgi:hypothetical protein